VKDLTNRKWDGILSLVWVLGGLLVLKLGIFRAVSPGLGLFMLFCAWWGVALLLVVSGLRGGSVLSVAGSTATVALFVCFLWITRPHHGSRPAPITAALTELSAITTALDAFRAENGYYPPGANGLQDLVRRPVAATNWHQYLDSIPKDPWGHDYIYDCPGKHTSSGYPYDLSSPGPPRANEPIVNWTRPNTKP
jgi:general secretion pathway protein G